MEWLNNLLGPYAPLITAAAAVFVPKILSKFGITNPAITPAPQPLNVPQVPTIDKPIADFLAYLDQRDAGRIILDVEDVRGIDLVARRLSPQPVPTLPLGVPSNR